MLIDCNTWLGRWPFAAEPAFGPAQVAERLQGVGVTKAIVSSLEAVLTPHAGPTNDALLRATETKGAVEWLAAPVIDPTLPDAVRQVQRYAAHERVVAVRLLPAYHGYRLFETRVRPVIEAATAEELMVMIQIRMEDPRMQHALLHLPTLATSDIVSVTAAHPKTRFLVAAAQAAEARIVVRGRPNVQVELSWLDGPEPVRELLPEGEDQLVFGTHAPLLEPTAAANKLACEDLTPASREKIEHQNIERALRPIAMIS